MSLFWSLCAAKNSYLYSYGYSGGRHNSRSRLETVLIGSEVVIEIVRVSGVDISCFCLPTFTLPPALTHTAFQWGVTPAHGSTWGGWLRPGWEYSNPLPEGFFRSGFLTVTVIKRQPTHSYWTSWERDLYFLLFLRWWQGMSLVLLVAVSLRIMSKQRRPK